MSILTALHRVPTEPNVMELNGEQLAKVPDEYRGHLYYARQRPDGKWGAMIWTAKGQRIWPGVVFRTEALANSGAREHIDTLMGGQSVSTRAHFERVAREEYEGTRLCDNDHDGLG